VWHRVLCLGLWPLVSAPHGLERARARERASIVAGFVGGTS